MASPADVHIVPVDSAPRPLLVGVLSDTHGRLYEDVVYGLHGVDTILHAGDVGSPPVLQRLAAVAPVRAVRGNTDTQEWARELPLELIVETGSVCIGVAHREADAVAALRKAGRMDVREGVVVVVCGHSHRPHVEWREGVLYLNPGAAGPARFGLGRSFALLRIDGGKIVPEIRALG